MSRDDPLTNNEIDRSLWDVLCRLALAVHAGDTASAELELFELNTRATGQQRRFALLVGNVLGRILLARYGRSPSMDDVHELVRQYLPSYQRHVRDDGTKLTQVLRLALLRGDSMPPEEIVVYGGAAIGVLAPVPTETWLADISDKTLRWLARIRQDQ